MNTSLSSQGILGQPSLNASKANRVVSNPSHQCNTAQTKKAIRAIIVPLVMMAFTVSNNSMLAIIAEMIDRQ
jgi:hypothetical protein